MDSITAINGIRDSLRTNLTDPYVTAGGNSRTWIYTDDPEYGTKYPRIQVKKVDNPTQVLTIGPNYAERERLFINLWFYSKRDFKLTIDNITYKNEQLVEYYLGLIKTILKAQGSTLNTAGIKSYKAINTSSVEYDDQTQLHYGAVTIAVEYFIGCS